MVCFFLLLHLQNFLFFFPCLFLSSTVPRHGLKKCFHLKNKQTYPQPFGFQKLSIKHVLGVEPKALSTQGQLQQPITTQSVSLLLRVELAISPSSVSSRLLEKMNHQVCVKHRVRDAVSHLGTLNSAQGWELPWPQCLIGPCLPQIFLGHAYQCS